MGLQAAELAERYLLKAGVLVDPKKRFAQGYAPAQFLTRDHIRGGRSGSQETPRPNLGALEDCHRFYLFGGHKQIQRQGEAVCTDEFHHHFASQYCPGSGLP